MRRWCGVEGESVPLARLGESAEKQLNGSFLEFGVTIPDPAPPEIRLDTNPPGAAGSFNLQICCDGDNVYAIWEDERDGRSEIYFNRSIDGAAWQALRDLI